MQYLRISWAAIVEDRLYEDTATLLAALRILAEAGNLEAQAPPLGKRVWRHTDRRIVKEPRIPSFVDGRTTRSK